MPGFQTERFVGLSETEKTELQCIICRDILRSPLFTKCCLQTFCSECINQWLINNSVCPYDRQQLEISHLTLPPRLLINMLGKLKISCTFKEKGCTQVLCLDELDAHCITCPFNKKICEKCNLESVDGHNCFEELLKLNKILDTRLRDTSIRIDSLEKENENYLQTIRELCLNSNKNQILKIRFRYFLINNSPEKSNSLEEPVLVDSIKACPGLFSIDILTTIIDISENQILIDARKHWHSMSVMSKNTPKEMTDEIVSIVSESLNKAIHLNDICTQIRKRVEIKFGGLWMCHLTYKGMASISCTVDNNCFVCIKIQDLILSVHKVYDEINFKKMSELLLKSDFNKQFSIYKTDMNSDTIQTVKDVVINAFEAHDNWTDFIENIFILLSKFLGGIWNCIIYKKYLGHFCVIPKTRQYIYFYIYDIDFAIFQISN